MYSLEEYQNQWYAKRIGTVYDDLEVVAIRYEDGRQIWTMRCLKCGAERETKNPEDYKKGRRKGVCQVCRERESAERKRAERMNKEFRKNLKESERESRVGHTYGSWLVKAVVPNKGYLVECTVCGRESIRGYKRTAEHTTMECTCDNNVPKYYDKKWIGIRRGHLTVIGYQGKPSRGFICKCDCGNEVLRLPTVFLATEVAYCGKECPYFKEDYDGRSQTRLYKTYQAMRSRCYNKNNKSYEWYGARGIKVCDEWLNSFDAFREWALSHGYTDELTIDRIDSDGNYCPENCQWLSLSENSAKSRPAGTIKELPLVEIDGEKKLKKDWCKEYGITEEAVRYRMKTYGMTFEEAVKTPKHQGYHK